MNMQIWEVRDEVIANQEPNQDPVVNHTFQVKGEGQSRLKEEVHFE